MMVNRYGCGECETHVDFLDRDGPLHCECGEELEFVGKVGCVIGTGSDVRPGARELVEEWRSRIVADSSKEVQAENRTLDRCAEELEELIDDG